MTDSPMAAGSLSLLLRIDSPCLRFEEHLQAGDCPAIEDHVATARPADQPALLAELLLLELVYRRRLGLPLSRDDYRRRFPGQENIVDRVWHLWQCGETVAHWDSVPSTELPYGMDDPPLVDALPPSGGYQDLVTVGAGGMGIVERAFDPRLKRPVALKRIRPDGTTSQRVRRFRLEAEAIARLRHPHIVEVYAWEDTDEGPMLVMEYVPGGNLEDWLTGRSLSLLEAVRLVAILARAVQAAHEAGVVHRDLKPANVLLAPAVPGNSGTVADVFPKLSDFGLARLAEVGEQQQGADVMVGTPPYMSPEQASGGAHIAGPKTDVWSMGVILYRCLCERLPFAGESVQDLLQRIKKETAPSMHLAKAKIPVELERLCLSCLEKNPDDRPTAQELAQRLEMLACGWSDDSGEGWQVLCPRRSGDSGEMPPVSDRDFGAPPGSSGSGGRDNEPSTIVWPPPTSPNRLRRWLIAAVLVGMLILGVILAWALS